MKKITLIIVAIVMFTSTFTAQHIRSFTATNNKAISDNTTLLSRIIATNNINKNIEKTNADVKGLLSKIEVNETNIETSQRVHVDLRNEDQRIIDFMTDWIQRVEDRIEDLRAEYLRMLTCYTGPNQNEQRKQT